MYVMFAFKNETFFTCLVIGMSRIYFVHNLYHMNLIWEITAHIIITKHKFVQFLAISLYLTYLVNSLSLGKTPLSKFISTTEISRYVHNIFFEQANKIGVINDINLFKC